MVVATKEIAKGKLTVMERYSPGVPAYEGIMKASSLGLTVASNRRLNLALVGSDEWKEITKGLPAWTGTMTAYVRPGRTFGEDGEKSDSLKSDIIIYVDPQTKQRWIFLVPEEHLDKKDSILVSEHPNYALVMDGKDIIVKANTISLVDGFPARDGWYLTDAVHGIPTGSQVDSALSNTGYLWRTDKRVGPVARNGDYLVYYRRYVILVRRPSVGFGVVVEDGLQASAKILTTSEQKALTLTRETDGKLVIEGTKEQVDTAMKLLKNQQ